MRSAVLILATTLHRRALLDDQYAVGVEQFAVADHHDLCLFLVGVVISPLRSGELHIAVDAVIVQIDKDSDYVPRRSGIKGSDKAVFDADFRTSELCFISR